jgi:hypothetical protein
MNIDGYIKMPVADVVSADRTAKIRALEWSDVSSLLRPQIREDIKIPVLRIVPAERDDLFKYAMAAKATTGLWEKIVFAAVALSAVAVLAMAFLVI